MNIETFSPALVLLFVGALLWILMDVHFYDFTRRKKWLAPLLILLLAAFNHLLSRYIGAAVYGKIIVFTMHIPFFLLFRYITQCSAVKTAFMILSGLIFTSPAVIVSGLVRRFLFDKPYMLLLSNLAVYIAMLALAQMVFRKGFNYLLKYGEDRLFLLLSVIPAIYYIYVFAVQNVDLSAPETISEYIIRYLPTLEVFAFYFLLLDNYKALNEKKEMEVSQITMAQTLHMAEQRIAHLHMTQAQTAVYRHDMRHHLTAIDGFLSMGKPQQAVEYIHKIQSDMAVISPKYFCENELINLLCSSLSGKAESDGISLKVEARVPDGLSVSDTELCSMISNAIENAINAVKALPEQQRWVEFYCELKRGKLLMEIKNPYAGQIMMRDGLPVSGQEGHGYGCRSIQAIAEHYNGLCSFEPENGVFTLRVVLPVSCAQESA